MHLSHVGLLFCALTLARAQQTPSALPPQILCTDGTVIVSPTLERVDPDGLLVRYLPTNSGLGLIKLKFRLLPPTLQSRFGYVPQAAENYEAAQAQAALRWAAHLQAADSLRQYRALAELHRAIAGDTFVSYSVALDNSGHVAAQGSTANYPPYPVYAPEPAGTAAGPLNAQIPGTGK